MTVYDSTKKPNAFFLHGSKQKDSVAACLCTVALLIRTSWPPISLMTRACHAHALGSVTKRLLGIPVESPYECKTRGEGTPWAVRG